MENINVLNYINDAIEVNRREGYADRLTLKLEGASPLSFGPNAWKMQMELYQVGSNIPFKVINHIVGTDQTLALCVLTPEYLATLTRQQYIRQLWAISPEGLQYKILQGKITLV